MRQTRSSRSPQALNGPQGTIPSGNHPRDGFGVGFEGMSFESRSLRAGIRARTDPSNDASQQKKRRYQTRRLNESRLRGNRTMETPPLFATYVDDVTRRGDLDEMKRVAAAVRDRLKQQNQLEAALHELERSLERRRR